MHAQCLAPAALARRIAFTACLVAASCASTSYAGDLRVTVLSPSGQPANGATVCAGTSLQPTQYGVASANSAGVALLRNVPPGSVQVTAHLGQSGKTLAHQMGSATQASITLQLASGVAFSPCQFSLTPANPQLGGSQPAEPEPLRVGEARPPIAQLSRITPPPPIAVRKEYCFGALGAQCGGAQQGIPTTALCLGGQCQINAGSWEHDECCFAHPGGMACQAGPLDYVTGHNGKCVNEWNKALARLQAGLNWTRRVDFNKPNSTGRVEFSEYCAPAGARVHRDDVRYCCSRQADQMPLLSGNVRVCR